MQVEHRIKVAAAPRTLFRIYEDVQSWHLWDPDTRQASLEGPFAAGSRGRLAPTKGYPVPMVLTQVVRDRCFTAESRIPFFRMLFEHELVPGNAMTEVIHRVTLSGPLRLLIGRKLVKQLKSGLPVTLGRLKVLAEAPQHPRESEDHTGWTFPK